MSVRWIEDQEHLKRTRKIARAVNPTGNEGTSALMFYVSKINLHYDVNIC